MAGENAPPFNPRAIAVALGFAAVGDAQSKDKGEGGLPSIYASGKGYWAEQIIQLAFAHGIKVREDADLAQILSVLDVDSPIPPEAFAAVAEILAYVYQANALYSQRGDATQQEETSGGDNEF